MEQILLFPKNFWGLTSYLISNSVTSQKHVIIKGTWKKYNTKTISLACCHTDTTKQISIICWTMCGNSCKIRSISNDKNVYTQFQKGEQKILTESMTIISFSSSLIHMVPQNWLRLIAQSLAFSSQLWNRLSCNKYLQKP